MNVLIIEDEALAAERIIHLVKQYDDQITILDRLDSVKSAVDWLEKAPAPDLLFFDIQLADGLSFEIFDQTKVVSPVIFTTAFDEYTLKAFKVNSIDYLLKPVKEEELFGALDKFKQRWDARKTVPASSELIQQVLDVMHGRYKTRFLVKTGVKLTTVLTSDILFFYADQKAVWMKLNSGRKLLVESTLEQLELQLNPDEFFRTNRKYLVSIKAVKEVVTFSNSRLKLSLLKSEQDEVVLVSRDKVALFKIWLGG